MYVVVVAIFFKAREGTPWQSSGLPRAGVRETEILQDVWCAKKEKGKKGEGMNR